MKRRKYVLYGVCFSLLWGCAQKPEPETQTKIQKKGEEPYIFLSFEQEHFNGGVWEEDMNDGVTSFRIKRSHLVKHGDRGYSLSLDYNFKLKKDSVGGVWIDVSRLDFTNYLYFGFWVKGEPDLGFTNIIGITFEDTDGNRETKMFAGVGSEWKKVEIFLGKIKKVNISRLQEINIVIEKRFANVPVGRIYLDDFYLR
ncbi:MAG: hypothetical protein J7J54_07355 [Candidatus Omnitrophica bacterium]|nr:hypothetical protein [Candidatus Omnitrophota bacterium]